MNNLYNNLRSYVFGNLMRTRQFDEMEKERKKLAEEPFYGYAIMQNGLIVRWTIAETEKGARDKKAASWWLENQEARVVELELVEKKK